MNYRQPLLIDNQEFGDPVFSQHKKQLKFSITQSLHELIMIFHFCLKSFLKAFIHSLGAHATLQFEFKTDMGADFLENFRDTWEVMI